MANVQALSDQDLDAAIAAKSGPASLTDTQLDAAIAAKQSEPTFMDKAKGFAKKAVDIGLPVAGAIGAGALAGGAGAVEGLATGPGAVVASPTLAIGQGVAGGAMGYAAGKQLARLIDRHVFGDDGGATTAAGLTAQTAEDLKGGAEFEMGGRVIGAVPEALGKLGTASADTIGKGYDYTPAPNASEVNTAAKGLNLNLPKAIGTDNPAFQKAESGLSQSGSFTAQSTRDTYNDFYKGLDAATQKVGDLQTPKSTFAIGKDIGSDIEAQVASKRAPVNEMYNDLQPSMQKIPVDQGVVNKAFGSLRSNPIFQTKDGIAALEDAKQAVLQQPELNSLKEFRSTIHDSVDPQGPAIDGKRADALYNAVTKIRDNSINTLKNELPTDLHPEIDDVIDRLSLADKAHASNVDDLNGIRALVGSKNISSSSQFLNRLSTMDEATIANRAANLDVASLQNLKDTMPSVFDKAQAARINEMVQNASASKSGFNFDTFMRQYKNMGEEERDLIFSPQVQSHIENVQTVKQAIPPKLGPSGTPEGMLTMDKFNPKRNLQDYLIRRGLDAKVNAANTVPDLPAAGAAPVSAPAKVLQMVQPGGQNPAPAALPAAAQNPPAENGPDRWAFDGANKLMAHTQDQNQKRMIQSLQEKASEDPKLKELLMDASGFSPGSKAMQSILNEINQKYGEK